MASEPTARVHALKPPSDIVDALKRRGYTVDAIQRMLEHAALKGWREMLAELGEKTLYPRLASDKVANLAALPVMRAMTGRRHGFVAWDGPGTEARWSEEYPGGRTGRLIVAVEPLEEWRTDGKLTEHSVCNRLKGS